MNISKDFSVKSFISWANANGWVLFPLHRIVHFEGRQRCTCDHGRTCSNIGKDPAWKWKDIATPQPLSDLAKYIWDDEKLQSGFGVNLGLSKLVVVDIDPRNGGVGSAAALFRDRGVPETLTVTTGSRGVHLYFKAPAWVDSSIKSTIKLGDGVELLSGAHYAVAPFSPHAHGTRYEPDETPIAELPEWLANELKASVAKQEAFQSATSTTSARTSKSHQFDADLVLKRAAAYVATISPAVSGKGGSRVTSHVACVLANDFQLSDGEAMEVLRQWNASCSPPWDDEELARKIEWAREQPGDRGRLLNANRSWTAANADWEFTHDPARMAAIIDLLFAPERAAASTTDAAAEQVATISVASIATAPTPADAVADIASSSRPWLASPLPDRESLSAAYDAAAPRVDRCPEPKTVLMKSNFERCHRIMFVDCRRLSCPFCHARKREQYHATIRQRLREHAESASKDDSTGDDAQPVHIFTVASDREWQTVGRTLRRRGSEHFRLAFPDGSCMIISSLQPTSAAVTNLETIDADAAAARMCDAISNMAEIYPKMFATSNGWRLVGEILKPAPAAFIIRSRTNPVYLSNANKWEPKSHAKRFLTRAAAESAATPWGAKVIPLGKWTLVSMLDSPEQCLFDVLQHHGVKHRSFEKRGAFFGWRAWEWDDAACKRCSPRQVNEDLRIGEVFVEVDAFGDGAGAVRRQPVRLGRASQRSGGQDDGRFI